MKTKLVIFAGINFKDMKRFVFITIILLTAMSAAMSCGSFGGKKNAAETELDDSTKTAMEMERLRKEEELHRINHTSVMITHENVEALKYNGKNLLHREEWFLWLLRIA